MRLFGLAVLLALTVGKIVHADVLYSQTPVTGSGAALIQSSWLAPDGFDGDIYTWDDFQLSQTSLINQISWRGGQAQTVNFNVSLYASIAAGTQPNVTTPDAGGNAALVSYNATLTGVGAGTINGFAMYDYSFALPTAFSAQGGTKYWLRVLADDGVWGIAKGTGGDSRNFRYFEGLRMFQAGVGDTAFTLSGSVIPEPNALALLLGGAMTLPLTKSPGRRRGRG